MDVDGVLSDGSLYFSNSGDEIKAFCTPDGLGIKLLKDAGITPAIITGRNSLLLSRRADNLGIKHIYQGRDDKLVALKSLCADLDIPLAETAYIGDDLPDLSAIVNAGLGMTPANGSDHVKAHADWIGSKIGGRGAVREASEFILAAQGKLDAIVAKFLSAGV
jgi:3-deoxy-D-manno-octulosonate 8-phosphate phosphatase (KDO 8-P phosphatase)